MLTFALGYAAEDAWNNESFFFAWSSMFLSECVGEISEFIWICAGWFSSTADEASFVLSTSVAVKEGARDLVSIPLFVSEEFLIRLSECSKTSFNDLNFL